jgi:hypothetical protein
VAEDADISGAVLSGSTLVSLVNEANSARGSGLALLDEDCRRELKAKLA